MNRFNRPVVRISRKQLPALIESFGSAFYTIVFHKKPEKGFAVGELRQMTTRNGVKVGVKGTGSPIKADCPVRRRYDFAKLDWRSINLDTTTEVRANGKVYVVVD